MLRTPKSCKALRKLVRWPTGEVSAQTTGKPILIEGVDCGEGGRDGAARPDATGVRRLEVSSNACRSSQIEGEGA
jgi:hypothetical protein